nr:PREDICTED: uncharacterized protein LOC106705510 [Latimeria chalumnae]|eukprot:XP_014350559.1 PREDICTED: uncharacterized protein LOC106705510 [Latimeria chalumnae]
MELNELPGETADTLAIYLTHTLKKNKIEDKCIALCADNTNTNFGGASRAGNCNVLKKPKAATGRDVARIGCTAHIMHNAIQTAADVLPVDVECITVKIYKYFYIYTVRVQQLKEFCDFVEITYKDLFGHCATRWLSLLSAVE